MSKGRYMPMPVVPPASDGTGQERERHAPERDGTDATTPSSPAAYAAFVDGLCAAVARGNAERLRRAAAPTERNRARVQAVVDDILSGGS